VHPLGWSKEAQIPVTQDDPGPLTLLALEMEIVIG
jgi:hypothetical protein